jgi:hypothetical protein
VCCLPVFARLPTTRSFWHNMSSQHLRHVIYGKFCLLCWRVRRDRWSTRRAMRFFWVVCFGQKKKIFFIQRSCPNFSATNSLFSFCWRVIWFPELVSVSDGDHYNFILKLAKNNIFPWPYWSSVTGVSVYSISSIKEYGVYIWICMLIIGPCISCFRVKDRVVDEAAWSCMQQV